MKSNDSPNSMQRINDRIASYLLRGTLFLSLLMAATGLHAQHLRWERLNGLAGGNVQAIAADSSGRIFVGSEMGIFRSGDGGARWMELTTVADFTGTSLVAVPDGSLIALDAYSQVLLRSTDHGDSWQRLPRTPSFDLVAMMALPSGDILAMAKSPAGSIYRSRDGGRSWELAHSSANTFQTSATTFLRGSDGAIYVNGYARILRSRDEGASWDELSDGLPALPNSASTSSIIETGNGSLIVATAIGLYRSTDHGDHWSHMLTGFGALDTSDLVNHTILWPLPGNRLLIAYNQYGTTDHLTMNHLLISDDGGEHWSAASPFLNDRSIYHSTTASIPFITMFLRGTGGTLYAGTFYEGMYASTDGGSTWSQSEGGFGRVSIDDLVAADDGRLFAADKGGVYRSDDDGSSWRQVDRRAFGHVAVGRSGEAVASGDHFFYQAILVSTDAGQTWDSSNTYYQGECSILAITRDGVIFMGSHDRPSAAIPIIRSLDHGRTWSECTTLSSTEQVSLGIARSFSVGSGGTLLVGMETFDAIHYPGGAYRTDDNGATWRRIESDDKDGCYAIAMSPQGAIYQQRRSNEGLFRSLDGGTTFTLIDGPFFRSYVAGIVFNAAGDLFVANRGNVFATTGQDTGIFRSTDNGATWTKENDGIPVPYISVLAADPGGRLYAVADGRLYRTTASTLGVDQGATIATGSLLRAVPNPSTGSASIRVTLSEGGPITLEIYDMRGRMVTRLADGYRETGEHRFTWDAADAPAGVYAIRLRAGGRVMSERMVLMR